MLCFTCVRQKVSEKSVPTYRVFEKTFLILMTHPTPILTSLARTNALGRLRLSRSILRDNLSLPRLSFRTYQSTSHKHRLVKSVKPYLSALGVVFGPLCVAWVFIPIAKTKIRFLIHVYYLTKYFQGIHGPAAAPTRLEGHPSP